MTEIEKYKIFIEDIIATNNGDTFYNSGAEHASLVMSKIFSSSNDIVRIHCGNLKGDVCGDKEYLNSLDNFLSKKNTQLHILMGINAQEEMNKSLKKTLKFFQDNYDNKLKIKITQKTFSESSGNKVHFSTGDDKSFRLEYNTEEYMARCSFNNPKTNKNLAIAFDNLFNNDEVTKNLILE